MALNSIRAYEITCDGCEAPFTGSDGSQPEGALYDTSDDALADIFQSTWQAQYSNIHHIGGGQQIILTRALCPQCKPS